MKTESDVEHLNTPIVGDVNGLALAPLGHIAEQNEQLLVHRLLHSFPQRTQFLRGAVQRLSEAMQRRYLGAKDSASHKVVVS